MRGLPLNAVYQVSEDEEDYRSAAAGVDGFEDPAAGTIDEDVFTSYLNERSGVIPTGAALAVLPGAAVLAAGGAGLFFLGRRRAKRGSRFEA